MFGIRNALPPFDRSPENGIRCVIYADPAEIPEEAKRSIRYVRGGRSNLTPVGDSVFEVYARQYTYDRLDLNARVEHVDDDPRYWSRQTASFDAPYGNERILVYLYLPKATRGPFQVVVFSPGNYATTQQDSDKLRLPRVLEAVLRSGRAVLYPVYKGTYERRLPVRPGGAAARDLIIMTQKDLARSIDWLETREDIRHERIAYLGTSRGAAIAPVMLALEQRLSTGLLLHGGLYDASRRFPEADPLHFAPRVKIPVLMVNGRYDFLFPSDTSQEPLFRLFAAPLADKRYVTYDTSHGRQSNEVIAEALDWLDKYLGRVETRSGDH
jgi:dienelactone hydrolase